MDGKLTLEVVVPQRRLLREEVDSVTAPGAMGCFGVLPGHTPLLTALEAGELSYQINGDTRYLATSGGYAEVRPDTVTILAETAEPTHEIDLERAQQAKERAEERLRQRDDEEIDFSRAQAALQRSLARILVAARSTS